MTTVVNIKTLLTDKEAAIEGSDEVETGAIDEGDMIARIQSPLVHQQRPNALGLLVQLTTRHRELGLALVTMATVNNTINNVNENYV